MKIMLDTNIFISMIFFPSAQTRELTKKLTDSHQIVVCDYVIEELRLVTDRIRFWLLFCSFSIVSVSFRKRFSVSTPFDLSVYKLIKVSSIS